MLKNNCKLLYFFQINKKKRRKLPMFVRKAIFSKRKNIDLEDFGSRVISLFNRIWPQLRNFPSSQISTPKISRIDR